MAKKKDKGTKVERRIWLTVAILVLCIIGVAAYGIGTVWSEKSHTETDQKTQEASEADLDISGVIIGDKAAEVGTEEKDGEEIHVIKASLPVDFPFEKTTLSLELPSGAKVSDESNCVLTDLGGRWVVNLTVENAKLVVEAGESSRTYYFRLDIE